MSSTRRLAGRVGIGVLHPILAILGAPEFSPALKTARHMQIVLKEVRRDWLHVGDLARYLESGTMPGSEHLRRATENQRLFIVTSILKSASLCTVVDRQAAQSIKARAGTPDMSVRVEVEQSRETSELSEITFTGRTPLAFAFQAIRLVYEDGVYSDYATAHGLSGYAWATNAGPVEGTLSLSDDLNEIST